MTRYVAFLRGINVGGHTVKMDELRKRFEAMGFERVGTFIASGNVLFESDELDAAALERRIERALKEAYGYEMATFLRTDEELAVVAAHEPFAKAGAREGDRRHVVFLREAPDAAARKQLEALSTDQDLLDVHDRELHWLRRGQMMDATVGEKEFRKVLGGAPTTARNLNTVRRLADKVAAEAKG